MRGRWIRGGHPASAWVLAQIESLCPKLADFLELVPSRHFRPHQNYLVYVGVRLLDLHWIFEALFVCIVMRRRRII